jgi:ferrous iron transport protein A
MPLSELTVGKKALVTALNLDPREVDWLRAVGLFEGARIRVLRRAPFGGPLHLRTASGAEFAVDRQLARRVGVALDEAGDA